MLSKNVVFGSWLIVLMIDEKHKCEQDHSCYSTDVYHKRYILFTQVDHKDTLSIIISILDESQISTEDVGTEYDTGKTKITCYYAASFRT